MLECVSCLQLACPLLARGRCCINADGLEPSTKLCVHTGWQHKPRSSSCHPSTTCDQVSAKEYMKLQPCRSTGSCSPDLPPAAIINSRFKTATQHDESPDADLPCGPQVPRKASMSMRARSRETSRVASQIVASAVLPDSLLQGGFPKSVTTRSFLKQYDTTSASISRGAGLHRGQGNVLGSHSRQDSGPVGGSKLPPSPAFAGLVERPQQVAGASTPALRYASVTCEHARASSAVACYMLVLAL